MRWSPVASTLGLGLALLGGLAPAHAFWPLTRGVVSLPDTLTPERLQKRFATWEKRPLAMAAADTAGAAGAQKDSTASLAGLDAASLAHALAARAKAPGPGSAGTPAETPPPPPTAAAPDSTVGATPATGTGADSTVGAASATGTSADSTAAPTPEGTGPMAALAAAATANRGFAPRLESTLRSSNDAMNMNTTVSSDFRDPSGASVTSTISYGDDISLTQNTDQTTRGLSNLFSLPLRSQGLQFDLSTSNRKLERVGSVSLNNARTRNTSDDRGATAKAGMSRQLLAGLGANTFYARTFAQNEQNIQVTQETDTGRRRHQGTGQSYGLGVNFDRMKWMTLKARLGRNLTSNMDRSLSFARPGNEDGRMESTSRGDTASVDATLPVAGWLTKLTVGFRTSRAEDSYTDVAPTTSGTPTGQIGNYALETRRNFSRSLQVAAGIQPLKRLTLNFNVLASRDSVSYALRPNLFSDAQKLNLTGNGRLNYGKNNALVVNFESMQSDVDQDEPRNPVNALTRLDKDNKLYAEVAHGFTATFKVKAYGEIRLTQGFYAHPGPQGKGDRDELRTRLGLDLDGQIHSKATGRVSAYLRTYDQAFIDPRRSSSSKNETEYVVRPSFTYRISPQISVDQSYGLSATVLDQVFNPGLSTLNRNHFMRTHMDYTATARLHLGGDYDYVLQDNGRYTREPGTDVRGFSPEARTKRDGLGIGLRYRVLEGDKLVFTSRQEYVRERRTTFVGGNAVNTAITERGNLALGLDSQFDVGEFKLRCALRRNQSFNVALNRKVYYNVESTLSYTF